MRRLMRIRLLVAAFCALVSLTACMLGRGGKQTDDPEVTSSATSTPDPLAVLAQATLDPNEIAMRFRPGPPWDGKGRAGRQSGFRTQAEMEQFADFPLFWLGPEFAGYNLVIICSAKSSEPDPDMPGYRNEVSFLFGECNLQGRDSCPFPITFKVESLCSILPEKSLTGGQAIASEIVRGGGQVVRYSQGAVSGPAEQRSISGWLERQTGSKRLFKRCAASDKVELSI